MENFIAGNGLTISIEPDDDMYVQSDTSVRLAVRGSITRALREFFQHERDQGLGRWRWPKNPDYVVYPSALYLTPSDADLVTVFNERTGQSSRSRREDEESYSLFSQAARAYFAAHPEPRPWHSAKEGEIWEVIVPLDDPQPRAVVARTHESATFVDPRGRVPGISVDSPEIVFARRIWPDNEGVDDF